MEEVSFILYKSKFTRATDIVMTEYFVIFYIETLKCKIFSFAIFDQMKSKINTPWNFVY